MSRIAVMCFFSKTFELKNVQFEFHKLYVNTYYCFAVIHGRYCIQKSNNDHFHP